jgi:3-hydroxyacyl-CoA dehydrogenase
MYPGEPAFFVPALLREKVAAGDLGRKSGRGFYKWKGNTPLLDE